MNCYMATERNKRGQKRYSIVWVEYKIVNGKTKKMNRRKRLGDAKKAFADEVLKQKRQELRELEYGLYKPQALTISEACEKKIKDIELHCTESTQRMYRDATKKIIEILGDMNIQQVTTEHVKEWQRAMILDKKMAKTSTNIHHRHLSAIFSFLLQNKHIKENPFKNVKSFKVEKKQKKVIPLDQVLIFFSNINNLEEKAFFLIMYFTGCRPGELSLSKKSAFDPVSQTITFEPEITKTKIRRTVYVHDTAAQTLKKWLERNNTYLLFPLFFSHTDRSIPAKRFKKILQKTNLPEIYTPYSFRHSFATDRNNKRGDLKKGVSTMIGHSSITTTDTYYTHDQVDVQKEIVESMVDPLNGDF